MKYYTIEEEDNVPRTTLVIMCKYPIFDEHVSFSREDILAFIYNGAWIREVTLQKGAKKYKMKGPPKGWRADHVLLGNRRRIDINVIRELIEEGADIHADNDRVLRWASEYGQTEIVKLLLDYGANINAPESSLFEETYPGGPLRLASHNGHLEVVRLLIDHGADVHAAQEGALFDACQRGNLEIVKYLLEHGADIHAADFFKEGTIKSPLISASMNGHLEIVMYLLHHGADIQADKDLALSEACQKSNLEIVKYLLEHGADIRAVDFFEGGAIESPLISASMNGHLEIVMYLLHHGADIHADQDRALRLACQNGHLEIVKYLLDHGADIHADQDGPLRLACRGGTDIIAAGHLGGHLEVIGYLLDHGADVHAAQDK